MHWPLPSHRDQPLSLLSRRVEHEGLRLKFSRTPISSEIFIEIDPIEYSLINSKRISPKDSARNLALYPWRSTLGQQIDRAKNLFALSHGDEPIGR
jgi:hypothetical protein